MTLLSEKDQEDNQNTARRDVIYWYTACISLSMSLKMVVSHQHNGLSNAMQMADIAPWRMCASTLYGDSPEDRTKPC